jgi:hypothetical protein
VYSAWRSHANGNRMALVLHADGISNAIGITMYVSCLLDTGMIRSLSEFTTADPVTPAATAIFVLFDSAIFATNMLVLAFEIFCMTAGTVWRVL